MRKVLITCKAHVGEPDWYAIWQLSRERFQVYARRHGYDYREFFTEDFSQEEHPGVISGRIPVWNLFPNMTSPCWYKIPAIDKMIREYDLVVYLDNDCLILDLSRDIAAELPEDKWLAMHDSVTPDGCGPNIGVVVTRGVADPGSLSNMSWIETIPNFWRRAWTSEAWRTARWTDNGQVMHLLGYTTAPPLRKLRDTEYTPGYHILGPEWNWFGSGKEPGEIGKKTRIAHAAWGRDGAWKLEVIRKWSRQHPIPFWVKR